MERKTVNHFIDGGKIAEEILESLEEVEIRPRLEIIQVGENPASKTYIEEKMSACKKAGFEANLNSFSEDVEEEKVLEKIREFNEDCDVDGILVQLPLPDQIDNHRVFETLDPKKDVDGLTPLNLGKTLRGKPDIVPCSVRAIERIFEHENIELEGKNVVVINNSNLIGRPLAMCLTQKDATVTLCHEKTSSVEKHTRNADIVVTATGEPELLKRDWITEDAIVIDAGYNASRHSDSEKVEEKVRQISPVPGGVGPVTVAVTLENLLECVRLSE